MLGGQVVNQSKRIFHVAARISAVPHDVAEKAARTRGFNSVLARSRQLECHGRV